MEKTQDVERKITDIEAELAETVKGLHEARKRHAGVGPIVEAAVEELKNLKKERQGKLAVGAEVSEITSKIKAAEEKTELATDEKTGLEEHIKGLEGEENRLRMSLAASRDRILQIKAVDLAGQYNELAEQLAGVVRRLNETIWKLEKQSQYGKECLSVFYLEEGSMQRIPRAYYDADGCTLETYVSRHPGQYPSGMDARTRCFYDSEVHREELRKRG